ncbi:MAG: GNAT family N-acetyltransferase [Prevotella sp.]|jgi:N-acetylglutamate synthase-like GNAT family acetyltransferase|nr:GNAT family N-acetyltransferase [Prevotella sp.]
METKVIISDTPDYDKMVDLRYRILREPLGLTFSPEYLEKEKNDILCVCEENSSVIGCCILTPVDNRIIQLRQMAVDNSIQKKGIGAKVLHFAEQTARERGFNRIILHARKVAVGFYLKYNYNIIGEEFTEVGIPHYEMEKII